ncbi:hypothetical protein IFM89_004275 [Coptis chinensis]|uniref:PORR domain-containing protein n=1 Tax=Coptis chinensis TaxID=261450 RepID=A0A835MBP6_9MAGN|nr:hypothetical protein IFM89_004275 [Coptis chinensis]
MRPQFGPIDCTHDQFRPFKPIDCAQNPIFVTFFYISRSALYLTYTPSFTSFCSRVEFKHTISNALAIKLQKLLMLSCHRRILLSKLVHLATDHGLPPNFHSRLCNDYPERFKIVETLYGRALELVSWDPDLANLLPMASSNCDLIVDRPLKFK